MIWIQIIKDLDCPCESNGLLIDSFLGFCSKGAPYRHCAFTNSQGQCGEHTGKGGGYFHLFPKRKSFVRLTFITNCVFKKRS